MKNVFYSCAYPLAVIAVSALGMLCEPEGVTLYSLYLAVIVFFGGYILSKIENKKAKLASVCITDLYFIISAAVIFISANSGNRDDAYGYFSVSIVVSMLAWVIANDLASFGFAVMFSIISVAVTALSLLSSKMYCIEDKRKKTAFFSISSVVCIALFIFDCVIFVLELQR